MQTTQAEQAHGAQAEQAILLHHFDDLQQQKDSSSLGMWAFLATEVMFFGGLFAAYALYRTLYPGAFVAASRHQNVILGFINTAVLLCSSLTMAFAVRSSQLRDPKKTVRFLLATMALGSVFLGIKLVEWTADYHEHLVPGINWDWEKAQAAKHESEKTETGVPKPSTSLDEPYTLSTPPSYKIGRATEAGQAQMYFVLYFGMTGLHAFHMVIGIIVVGIMTWLTHIRWLSGGGETQIEVTGLYWHFVDVVWVFLYPLLYLIDVRPE